MRILALDPATVTGICFYDGREFGCSTLDLSDFRKKSSRGEFYRFYHKWLLAVISKFQVDTVVYEQPMGRSRGQEFLAGIAAVIEAADNVAAVLPVNLSSVKKFATGTGNASKDMMIDAARKSGAIIENEHEADAYHVFRYFLENHAEEPAESLQSGGPAG